MRLDPVRYMFTSASLSPLIRPLLLFSGFLLVFLLETILGV